MQFTRYRREKDKEAWKKHRYNYSCISGSPNSWLGETIVISHFLPARLQKSDLFKLKAALENPNDLVKYSV